MGFSITKYNRGGVNFDYKLPEGASFKKLAELGDGFVGVVKAVGISHKGKYGDSPFIIGDGFGVWLPTHRVNDISDICGDPEAVEAINAGKVCFSVYAYELEGKELFSINFVDAEPVD